MSATVTPPSSPAPVTDPDRPIWPFLLAMAAVAGLAELAFIIVNVSALPVYLEFGLGLPKLVGYSLGAFYLAEAAGNSPMGALGDRFGRRRLMVLGALTSVFTCLCTAALRVPEGGGPTAWAAIGALLFLRVLDGFGAAALWPSLFASVSDRVPPRRQAQAMSTLNITYLLGIAVGPFVGGLVNDTFSHGLAQGDPRRYVPSFFLAAACFAVAAAVAFFVAPRRSEQHTHHGPDEDPLDPHAAIFSLAVIKKAMRLVPMLLILGFITFCSIGLIAPYAKLFVMKRYLSDVPFGDQESVFGQLLLVPALIIAAVCVPLGRLSDRWGKSRSIHWGMGLCALSLWAILLLETRWAIVAMGSLLGLGFVLAFPSYMAYIADLSSPRERGGMIGAVRMAQGIGALAGAGLSAPLYNLDAQHLTLFITAGALLTIGFVLSMFYVREHTARIGADT